MLSVNYGNFLRKSETAKAVYEFKRPVYQFIANTVCVFCLAGAVTSGLALAYAHMATPKPVYSQELYGKAQSLNNNLSRGAALMKQGGKRITYIRLYIENKDTLDRFATYNKTVGKIEKRNQQFRGQLSLNFDSTGTLVDIA